MVSQKNIKNVAIQSLAKIMEYTDKIYGKIKIEEPVILELINSPSIQRLKRIDQKGFPKPYFPGKMTRFEHSIGVYFLLKKFGGSLKEQIAGIIHDISHTVFSHCGDYIFESGSETNQDFQDNIFEKVVQNSEIPSILEKYHLNVKDFLNEEKFPLKERPLPDLCADRIDYSLREAIVTNEIKKEKADLFLNNLKIVQNYWVFKNLDLAKEFSLLFLRLNDLYWVNPKAAVMVRTVGDTMKYALDKKYILKKDFWTTDKEILEKIQKFRQNDEILDKLLNRMEGKIKWELNNQNYDAKILLKSRSIDPLIKINKNLKRLSEIDKDFKTKIAENLKPREYYIKFTP